MSVASPAPSAPSARGSLNARDVLKLVRDAAIIGGGAAVAHLIAGVPGLDLGQYDDVLTPIVIILLTAIRRFLQGPSKA